MFESGGTFGEGGIDAGEFSGTLNAALGLFEERGEEGFAIVDQFEREAQIYLDQALRTALPYTEFFTQRAIDNMNRMFDISRSDVQKYYELSQAQTAPYREAGFQALDSLQDTLGIARPKSGSSAMYHAMENKAKEDALRRRMAAEATQTARDMDMSPQAAQNFIAAARYGTNPAGLNTALREYASSAYPRDFGLRATDSLFRDRGDPREEGADPGTYEEFREPNAYNDLLRQTFNRYNPRSQAMDFATRTSELGSELMRAIQSQSSRQRALANLGARTGYSHLQPRRVPVNA